MLTVETIGRIRREHFLKGKTIKEIARDLKVSRNTGTVVNFVREAGSASADEPFAEDDGELRLGLHPFARRPFPFLGSVVKNQI